MSDVRFNHVFTALMLLALASALLVPWRFANNVRGNIESAFAPVAIPARQLAAWLTGRLGPAPSYANTTTTTSSPAHPTDESTAQVLADNEQLRMTVASLTQQISELKRINGERDSLGEVGQFATRFRAIGNGADGRESLILQASALDGLAVGMPVLCREGLVGRVSAAGAAGAQVKLITDSGFRSRASFGRFVQDAAGKVQFVRLATPEPLVEGRGNGLMSVTNLALKEVKELSPGDWVVLSDHDDWPALLQGYLLGRIERVDTLKKMPLFAEVFIRPRTDLARLREVMVVTKK